MDIFRKKDVDVLLAEAGAKSLKKTLNGVDLILLGIGCIIGTGIFVLTGVAAAKYAGPALMLSFVLSGAACTFAALAYAELAAMVPIAGSAYTYSYAALGEFVAWIVGWNLILEYTVGASTVAVGWSGYVVGLLKSGGITLPKEFTSVPMDGGMVNVPAVLIILFLTWLLVLGTKESATLNRILVIIKLAAVFIFIALAGPKVNVANWDPFMPFGFSGVATGAAIVFFAYIGFDAVATAAEECKNPNKDLPMGIVGSLVICTALYIIVAAILTGVVPYKELNSPEPVALALRYIGYNIGSALVGTGALCGITTVCLVLMFGQSRIFFAMSRDGLIPSGICEVHPKYGTPYKITIVAGIGCAILAGLLPIGILAELTNIGTLFAFVVAGIGVLALRNTAPDLPRPFRCPAINIIAPLASLSCGYLMYMLPVETWIRFGVWSLIGIAIYFFYGYNHSHMNKLTGKANINQ
ncbi:MAG TPA: amino acid permease [Selenomonadales bacterium]|nr:amino acid permease [Selenomonadales bacterium]